MFQGDSRMSSGETKEQGLAGESGPRRPYVKPAFSFERVFETAALTCSNKPTNHTS